MEDALSNTRFRLHWNGPSDGDAQRQIDLLGDAIKENSYGITIDPRSLYAANGVIGEAVAYKIPVVVMLHPLPISPTAHLSFVLEDVREGGILIAKRLAWTLNGKGDVILVGLDSLTPGGEGRFDAVEHSLRQFAPDVRIVNRISGPPAISYFVASIGQALYKYPQVRGIVALDSHAAYAAASVVYRIHAVGRIKVVAFDQNTEVLAALRNQGVDAVVAQNMRQMGRIAVANVLADRQHKPVATYTYIKPILITRENIDDEDVQQILLMNWNNR